MTYKLVHELSQNTIHSGTKVECEMVLKALTTYGVRDDKFELVEIYTPSLSKDVRDKIIHVLADLQQDGFGDYGRSEFYDLAISGYHGLEDSTDQSLIDELEHTVAGDEDYDVITDPQLKAMCNLPLYSGSPEDTKAIEDAIAKREQELKDQGIEPYTKAISEHRALLDEALAQLAIEEAISA